MKFTKMQGAGNDYIYIDARGQNEDILGHLLADLDTDSDALRDLWELAAGRPNWQASAY